MKACIAVVLALCACSLGGKRPDYQYFVLTSQHALLTEAPRTSEPRALAVDPVTIPGYLDREQIATRTVGHHVVYSTTDRWAEPIDQAFERTLREELAARLAPAGIHVQPRGAMPTYTLGVDVLRFERIGPGHVELWARWNLRSDTDVLDSGETRMRIPTTGPGSSATAAALSEAIARMATDIAGHVRRTDFVAARKR